MDQQNKNIGQKENREDLPNQGMLNPDLRFTGVTDSSGSYVSKSMDQVSDKDVKKFDTNLSEDLARNKQ